MLQVKVQFEVRYTNILNFQTENRKILSPYLRLAEATFHNLDSSEEHIVLIFREENYYIDARWDRLILGYEGNSENIEDYQSISKHFIEILNKFVKLESFGKITNAVFARFLINETEGDDKSIKREFKKKYFTNNVPYFEGEEQDFAIIIENKKGNDFTKLSFGPYDSAKDVARLNLFSINPRMRKDIVERKGLLFEVIQGYDTSHVDFETFKRLYTIQRRTLNSFV